MFSHRQQLFFMNFCVTRFLKQIDGMQAILFVVVAFTTCNYLVISGLVMPIPLVVILGFPNLVSTFVGHDIMGV